ncbi:IS21 family transposase [Corynebacterium sp. HMSC29G08]|uniref:IS21 family transposase n=1 Tax=Corynebacterium sp. HMSC29G08 TaxID=1581069 RepID=UPI0008A15080|nr:IS21 family transposase [Corynebacterium sp. HMSC29G08]OFT86462.1 transposase [Corynebacterium sp. HMSC29G08]
MTDYRAVMTLLIKKRSYRQIEDQLGCSHRAISRANQALRSLGLTTAQQVAALTNDELDEIFVDKRTSGQGEFVPIDFDAVVKARTGRTKQTLQVLWARYTTTAAQPGQRHYSYDRFRQLVASHVDAAGLTARITHAPGHTMQVDWAGTKMRLYDPAGTQGAKVSIFVASLPYSGMLFACACVDQRQQSWLDAHRQAFDYFGGVCQVVVPDNASTASNAISTADRNRKVNDTYQQFLEHYNTAALPTRARRPKDKANVEAAVKIVTHKIIHALEGHQCVDLDELNGKIVGLVDAINTSMPFRSQQSSRRDLFEAHEQHLLADLPETPWQHTEWKRAKVAPDFHITVATVRYSVPHQLVGRTVDVRITGQVLTVFDQGTTVATHRVSHKRGAYVTDYEHIPSGMDSTRGLWTSDYFYREAQKIGPATRKVIEELIAAKAIPAQAYQSCRNVLSMGKHGNKPILEEACQRLTADNGSRRAVSYTAVKNMMAAVRKEHATRPRGSDQPPRSTTTNQSTALAVSDRDTTGAFLGGADQFSMDNLAKKGN